MKKIAIILLSILLGNVSFSQKLMTRTGEAKFDATVPSSIDEIKGTNNTVSCIFDETTGEFVALVLIKSFKFKSPLMEEHFNENYLESTKFPKSTFKGKVLNFDKSKLTATKTAYDLEGEINIHGITKKIKTKIYLSSNAGKVTATSAFDVNLSEYKIEIPSLVKDKIAKEAKLNISFLLG
jgi:polyisoprenoid-binding protein YceI